MDDKERLAERRKLEREAASLERIAALQERERQHWARLRAGMEAQNGR